MSRILVERIEALGQDHRNFPVLCHTLPPSATVDGVLGLDFFRGQRLVVDLRTGVVSVESSDGSACIARTIPRGLLQRV